MTRWALGLGFILFYGSLPVIATAQNVTKVQPYGLGGSNVSGTIASGGDFQQVFAANSNRLGCAIQNNGAHDMWVTIGVPTASASTDIAMTLAVGNVFHCGDNAVTLTGEVNITGTSSESFYASQY